MKKEMIDVLVKMRILRKRELDVEKVKSILNSAKINSEAVMKISLNEETSTIIFREIYESIRQLGEAKWLLEGYEVSNHEVALDILKDEDIKEKQRLNSINGFKKIRHEANYSGLIVNVDNSKEIIYFWKSCGVEILERLSKQLKDKLHRGI